MIDNLPAVLAEHLPAAANDRIRAALHGLDTAGWTFTIQVDTLVGVRRYPGQVHDTVLVLAPDVVFAFRHADFTRVWHAHGSIEDIVPTLNSLTAPERPEP